jgi:glycine/D-amino acid oxidase-like deaminating enzyme
MQENCFWIVDAPLPKPYIEKSLPHYADVLVIGGGFTGTSAALRLAKGGANVVLLEAHTIGWGASSRNGGQALSCLYRDLGQLVTEFGEEKAKAMFKASVTASNEVERIIKEENINCDYLRSGHIEAAMKPQHFDRLLKEQEALASIAGFNVRVIPKKDIRLELGTDSYYGLIVNDYSGSLQPAKYVQGLAYAAERGGAKIFVNTRVLEINRIPTLSNGAKFEVKTERGVISAKEILLAANAWVSQIAPQFRNKVFPAESFIIATEPLPEEIVNRLIPHKRVVYDTRNLLAYYKFSADRRMIFGGEGASSWMNQKRNIETLRRGMVRIFPELNSVNIDYYWSGTLGLTMDENIHAGQIDGMWYSMCYVGHGVSMATYMGEQIADAILGNAYQNPFGDIEITRMPFIVGHKWFENFGKAWMSLLDKIR